MIIEPGQTVSSRINSDRLIQFRGGETYNLSTCFLKNNDCIIETEPASLGKGKAKLLCKDSNYCFDISGRNNVTIRTLHCENIGNPTMDLIRGVDCGNIFIKNNTLRRGKMGISINRYQGRIGKIVISSNLIQENWNYAGKHGAGIYIADSEQDVEVTDNVFDQNGYLASKTVPDIYSHNAYLQSTNLSATITGNIFFGASSHGCQHRCGGLNQNNLYLYNPIHLSFGMINGAPCHAGGVTGKINRNLFLGSQSPLDRGYGIELGNILKASVENNLFLGNNKSNSQAIRLDIPARVDNPNQLVGILDLVFVNNLVEWQGGSFWKNPAYSPSAGGASKLGHLDISGIKSTNLPDFFSLLLANQIMTKARINGAASIVTNLINDAFSLINGSPITPPTPAPIGLPKITAISLFDADTDKLIAPLNGTINLPRVGANLNIVVSTDQAASSVQMQLDSTSHTEKVAPYAFGGDNSGDLAPIQIPDGSHSFQAIVLSSTGAISDQKSVSFTITSAPTPMECLNNCLDRHDQAFSNDPVAMDESRIARNDFVK